MKTQRASSWNFLKEETGEFSHLAREPKQTPNPANRCRMWCIAVAAFLLSVVCPASAADRTCIAISCPADVIVESHSPQGTAVNFAARASSSCGLSVSVTCTPPSGSLFPLGTTVVTCKATDKEAHEAVCSFTVTVTDKTAPALAVPASFRAHCTGTKGAVVEYSVTATDNADPKPLVQCTPASGTIFPFGTNVVKCIASDASGNRITKTFEVVVEGNCAANCLEIECPRSIETLLVSGTNRVVNFHVAATNRCERLPVTVICDPPSGSAFKLGVTTVQCLATDGYESEKCSFQVSVIDRTPPHITHPPYVLTKCQSMDIYGFGWAKVFYNAHATDNSGIPPQLTCTPPSGSSFRVGTNWVVCVASDISGNRTTNQFPVIVEAGPKCGGLEATVTELSPDNWGFELGLTSWTAKGDAFENQPARATTARAWRIPTLAKQMRDNIGGDYWPRLSYPIGIKGNYGISTADNRPFEAGVLFDEVVNYEETTTGELLSKPFVIEKPYISFLIGGTQDPDHLRVELLVKADPGTPNTIQIGSQHYNIELYHYAHGKEEMRRVGWSVDGFGHFLKGKTARIRIVDASPRGHINVDDFQFVDEHPDFAKVHIGDHEFRATLKYDGDYYDWDSPVWGFADMHTHPMSYLGFAQGVMFGQPDGGPDDPSNPEEALGNCHCLHDGAWPDNQCGNFLRMALEIGADGDGNNPHGEGWDVSRAGNNKYAQFRRWPVFSTTTHQQMWYEWIKRAYDGGLRTMVALCVNNGLLGSASQGPGWSDDLHVGDQQIKSLKEFVSRHSDFMEIAYDPIELRDIIRRNKLAVIIGSELDDIGNFAKDNSINDLNPGPADYQKVRSEIDRLYGLGMRYIFPVHLMNNKLGGTPVASVMLNMASRYLNGTSIQVEPAEKDDRIRYWFPENFDLSQVIEDHKTELILGGALGPVLIPLIPVILNAVAVTPSGSGAAVGAALAPLALLAGVGALPGALNAIPPNVWPVQHHYSHYPSKGEAPFGHRNKRGLTPIGEFAVTEMMRKGMMIDVDHMSQKTLDSVFRIAEANPVGYPLNSGHNSFRNLSRGDTSENNRSDEQMVHIRDLGGMFGVGYENSSMEAASSEYGEPLVYSSSIVRNDCGGTSKSVAQTYLYALESMAGRHVALGTDVDGLIPGPGPRFGPNSDFSGGPWSKADSIRDQDNGVLYTPQHGRPITGPAFIGAGIDPHKIYGFGSPEHLDGNNNMTPAYPYSPMQANFFPAVRLFYFLKPDVEKGSTQDAVRTKASHIVEAMTDDYWADGVLAYTMGLLDGIKGWGNQDLGIGLGSIQDLGRAVYQQEVLGTGMPNWVQNDEIMKENLLALRAVWGDYHKSFGSNLPLKRCTMGFKDWDINFEGVAHYGLLPDLMQDLTNVGLLTYDLDPLFHSADDFADMWVKTLQASHEVTHPTIQFSRTKNNLYDHLNLQWIGQEDDILEQTDDLKPNAVWVETKAIRTLAFGVNHVTIDIDHKIQHRFFRVRKHN